MKEIDKMTKKERKEYYNNFRNTWDINPTTRKEDRDKWKRKRDKEKADSAMGRQ